MINYSVKTGLDPEQAIDRAIEYFGPDGLGLEMEAEGSCCVTFEGSGGFVSITADVEDGETKLDITAREWEYDVRKFINQL
jgi:hypothetical protein